MNKVKYFLRLFLSVSGLATLIALFTFMLFRLFMIVPDPALGVSLSPSNPNAQANPWPVHLYAIPGDATTLIMAVDNVTSSCQGDIEFIAGYEGSSSPTKGKKDPNTDGRYVAIDPDFFPDCGNTICTSVERGTLFVKCTDPELESLTFNFRRFYAPHDDDVDVISEDSQAVLQLFDSSLDVGQYVIVMPTNIPHAAPRTVNFVGEPVTFRASGGLDVSDDSMNLTLRYSSNILGQVNPLTLQIFQWKEAGWRSVGQQNNFPGVDPRVTKSVKEFTTYVLGSTPLWCDSFNSAEGLDGSQVNNITQLTSSGKLELEFTSPPSGYAISTPYTPTLPIESWQTISYTANIPAGTNLTVSILDSDTTPLMTNVNSGADLTNLADPTPPSLRLRVDMTTTSNESPELLEWCLLAGPKKNGIYTPIVIK
ncbi:MAG: hypothetical protein KDJ52_12075 [Anaerolineae bacterium]|nr:hypothetical protein [Anaerolineae bacterium]